MPNSYIYLLYPVNLLHSSCKHVFSIRVENSVDPDQMASSETSWSRYTLIQSPGLAGQGLNDMGHVTSKPVFKVSNKESFKPVFSATETI